MTPFKAPLLIFLTILAGLGGLHHSAAQGTTFTYQGRLLDGAQPTRGSYDFIFLVYSDTNTAVPLVSRYAVTGLPVSNGLFTAAIDFGPGVFTERSAGWGSTCAPMARRAIPPWLHGRD